MSAAPALQLVPEPPRNGDRLIGITEVQALFPGRPKSRWWMTHEFCPAGKMKIGRDVYWWEREALAWISSHREIR